MKTDYTVETMNDGTTIINIRRCNDDVEAPMNVDVELDLMLPPDTSAVAGFRKALKLLTDTLNALLGEQLGDGA